jgi:hypothetical protein
MPGLPKKFGCRESLVFIGIRTSESPPASTFEKGGLVNPPAAMSDG